MIREKLRPGHTNHRRNLLRVVDGRGRFPANNPVEMSLNASNLPPYETEGPAFGADDGTEILHASNFVSSLQKVKAIEDGHFAGSPHDSRMPRWNYRDAFDAEYKAFRARTGWTVDQVAEALGKSVNMLNGYRREHGSIPPDDVIYRAAELFGCEPTRFMDDPAAATMFGPGYGAMSRARVDTIQKAMRALGSPAITDQVASDLVDELATRIAWAKNIVSSRS